MAALQFFSGIAVLVDGQANDLAERISVWLATPHTTALVLSGKAACAGHCVYLLPTKASTAVRLSLVSVGAQRMTDRYVLNVNEGVDTLHRNPGESCNTDDAVDRSTIDAKTAAALLVSGEARPCQHCYGPDE